MGKTAENGIETRILGANQKAFEVGLANDDVLWHVNRQSLIFFQRCWSYIEVLDRHIVLTPPMNVNFVGFIGDVGVQLNDAVTGMIAELRGENFIFTLDLSEE